MKITIPSNDLVQPLKTVARVADRKAGDITGHILIDVTPERLTLSAHNGQKQVALDVSADRFLTNAASFSICVPAQKFEQVVSSLPKDANVVIKIDGTKVIISSGRSRFSLATRPATDFPLMEFTSDQNKGAAVLPGGVLTKALRQVGFCAARNDMRVFLNGVLFDFSEGIVTLAASDGLRLGVVDLPHPGTPMQRFILPSTCIEDVCQFAGTGDIEIATSGSMARFTKRDGVLHTKLIEGGFPNYRQLLETAAQGNLARFNRDEFAGAVTRVSLLSDGSIPRVRLAVCPGSVSIESVGMDDLANDILPCDYHAAPLDIGFNGALAGEIVRSLDGDEIDVYFGGGASGTLLRGRDLPSHSFVLMPVRL
ncbi:DNA polymerase III subunit beta [Pseudomonas guariconensis]|uniref:DNA polymerase III subunit beta n=1 Tax=Pseudomonas guariconensis TaxID=1288410 RepID=UPI0039060968